MSWDDFDFNVQWERHALNLDEIVKGRKAKWMSQSGSVTVENMSDKHIQSCINLKGLAPEWKELFEDELKYRRTK